MSMFRKMDTQSWLKKAEKEANGLT